jgi:hypothetical protein
MNRILGTIATFITLGGILALAAVGRAADAQQHSTAGQPRIQVLNDKGEVLAQSDTAGADGAAKLVFDRPYQAGDRIVIAGGTRLVVGLEECLPECLVYSPAGQFEYAIPKPGPEQRAYPPKCFPAAHHVLTASNAREGADGTRSVPATGADGTRSVPAAVLESRNVALNPYDVRGEAKSFPHATSNSECRKEGVFAARNAIDGQTKNTGHGGWPYQSWGPDVRKDLWWKVDFGRPVEIEQVAIVIRADFPHDRFWHSATIEFSDGSSLPIELKKDREKQVFPVPKKTVTWLRLTDLVQADPPGWAALMEVEVMGREVAEAKAER